MLHLTFLGTGTSSGVPMVGCGCEVCRSKDQHDKRLRSSVMIESDTTRVVIDSGPDFRYQMLREDVPSLNAILLTHEHVDHIMGIDDIRAYNYFQHSPISIYATQRVQGTIKRIFNYAFGENRYPGVPDIDLHEIVPGQSFTVGDLTFTPISGWHFKLPVTGFRIGNLAYLTDFNFIEDKEREKLRNLDVLIVNALRKEKHISHFSLPEAIELSRKVRPKHTYFTHASHQLGLYETVNAELPEGMELAYDGLKIDF